AMAKAGKGLLEGTLQAGTSAVSDKLLDLVGLDGKSAADKGKDTRDYLAAAFPELNAWERAGADASSAGMVDAGFETLHEVITFLVSMQISISSLQTHNVNRCGRSRHLARKLSLRRKRSSPNVFEMAATETITSIILIKLI